VDVVGRHVDGGLHPRERHSPRLARPRRPRPWQAPLVAEPSRTAVVTGAGGRIINNGSISAHVPRPGSVAYTATKHAVTGLTRAVALDGRAHAIAVGQIDVGNAATEMTAGIATGARQADGSVRPEPTFDPAHVAATVAHMARLPLDVSMPFTTVLATGMPYLGRG
jgi:NAD(P)-dependent dehydrogenase (short-subunit alcohol dehydrogenase family)